MQCATWLGPRIVMGPEPGKTAPGVRPPEAGGTDPSGDPHDRVAHHTEARHEPAPYSAYADADATGLRTEVRAPSGAGLRTEVRAPNEGQGQRRRLGRGDRTYLLHRLTAAITRREANSSRPAISREREIVTAVNEAFPLVIDAMEDENFDMELVCNRLDVLDCAAAILGEILIAAREEYQGLVAVIAEEEYRERLEVPA